MSGIEIGNAWSLEKDRLAAAQEQIHRELSGHSIAKKPRVYSPILQTVFDDDMYTVLRCVTWRSAFCKLQTAHYLDIAVVWDEDHDDRIIGLAECLYALGLLPFVLFIGERKGCVNVVISDDIWFWLNENERVKLDSAIGSASESFHDDPWSFGMDSMSHPGQLFYPYPPGLPALPIFLANIRDTWALGIKPFFIPRNGSDGSRLYLGHNWDGEGQADDQ